MTPELRAKLTDRLGDWLIGTMFGDGLNEQYIMDGFPAFKGLDHMTDQELLQEFELAGFPDPWYEPRAELAEDIADDEELYQLIWQEYPTRPFTKE